MNNYFSHDSNARNDVKLIKVRMSRLGAAGYGIYWMIIERLREENNYMSIKDYNAIAFDLRVDASDVKSVVEDFGLFAFTNDGEYFYSESLNDRMAIKDEKSKKLSEAGKRGAKKRWASDSHAKGSNSHPIATPPKNDGNKSKVKESKGNINKSSSKASQKPDDDAEPLQNLVQFYQQNIGPISPLTTQNIYDAVNNFTEHGASLQDSTEIVKLALISANDNGAKSWRYIDKILLNWEEHNCFTLDQVKAEQAQWQRKKQGGGKSNDSPREKLSFEQNGISKDFLEGLF